MLGAGAPPRQGSGVAAVISVISGAAPRKVPAGRLLPSAQAGIMRPVVIAALTHGPCDKRAQAADGPNKVRSEWCIMGRLGAQRGLGRGLGRPRDPTGQKPEPTGHPFSASRWVSQEPSDANPGHPGPSPMCTEHPESQALLRVLGCQPVQTDPGTSDLTRLVGETDRMQTNRFDPPRTRG